MEWQISSVLLIVGDAWEEKLIAMIYAELTLPKHRFTCFTDLIRSMKQF